MADQFKWEFTADGATVGGQEFKLRPTVGGEELLRYAERVTEDTEVYKVLTAAIGSLSRAEGDRDRLLDRVRKTVKAREDASFELANLTAFFGEFFEPAGIVAMFPDAKSLSQFSQEVVEKFSSRKKA